MPQLPSLSEADAADADGFLAEMLFCLPVLGLAVFSSAPVVERSAMDLVLRAKGVEARGIETPQGFVVRTGSHAVTGEVASIHA